jgi:2',3'-cyclic-nucleotide 2'-phosphodiesterase (5'-nucleotidase family)
MRHRRFVLVLLAIGRSAVPLEAHEAKLRTQETNLGNFVTDVMRARMDADVALVNSGGIRTDRTVPAGPLTKRDVHALLPFTNVVMKIEMPGPLLRRRSSTASRTPSGWAAASCRFRACGSSTIRRA